MREFLAIAGINFVVVEIFFWVVKGEFCGLCGDYVSGNKFCGYGNIFWVLREDFCGENM